MWWLWLACASSPTGIDLSGADVVSALEPDGWAVGGCSEVRSTGVRTTACTLRREDEVAVVTLLTYDRAADAERAWSGGDGEGWRAGRQVAQVDVFDRQAARSLLDLGGTELEAAGFQCDAGLCRQQDAQRRSLVAHSTTRRGAAGYEQRDGRTAAVQDLAAARALVARLRAADGG
jgi:hypothetical protein